MLRRVGDLQLVGAAYHIPSGSHPDIAALEVLAGVLESPPSGRLYKALVESQKAANVSASVNSWHDPGVFDLMVEVRKENSLDDAREIMIDTVEKMGVEDISNEEVERAKRQILKRRELAAADSSQIAVDLSNWASQGDWRLYFLHRDRIEKVTPQDVRDVADRYFRKNNRTVGLFIPTEKPDRSPIPASPDLEKLLAGYHGRASIVAGEAFDVSPKNIEARSQRSTLPEGIKLVLLPKKTRGETVFGRVVLRYGNLENLRGFEAAADFMPSLMTRGTKQLSRQQIQDLLDKNHATLSGNGDVGNATFTFETKRANLPAVLKLLRQIIREPSFPADEFDVLGRQELAALDENLTDPQALAMVKLRRTVSPFDQADVRHIASVEEQIRRDKALKLDHIKKLYTDFLGAQAGRDFAGRRFRSRYLRADSARYVRRLEHARSLRSHPQEVLPAESKAGPRRSSRLTNRTPSIWLG